MRTRAVPHIGTLTRTLPVSLERLYENALDWEHLPWLHASSFSSIEKLEAGDWGWRARAGVAGSQPEACVEIELRLDRPARRWITTTLAGPGVGSEIWTHCFVVGEREIDIVVDFFAPGVEEAQRAAMGEAMVALYTRLYDEDVAMMLDRQAGLDARRAPAVREVSPVAVGSEREVRDSLPRCVEAFGDVWRIVEAAGELVAHAARCPHRLGSLLEAPVQGDELLCPWHGYRFDVRTRECVSGARCTLPQAPRVRVEDGRVVLRAEPEGRE